VDLTDNKFQIQKLTSLHVRPFGDERLEVIVQSKFGYGNTVYQGANRYYLNNFLCSNIKLNSKEKISFEDILQLKWWSIV
jgi:hypothetical protein